MFLIGHLHQDIFVIDVGKKVSTYRIESSINKLLMFVTRSLDPRVSNE